MSWAIAEVHSRRVLDPLSEKENKQAGIRACQRQTEERQCYRARGGKIERGQLL